MKRKLALGGFEDKNIIHDGERQFITNQHTITKYFTQKKLEELIKYFDEKEYPDTETNIYSIIFILLFLFITLSLFNHFLKFIL